MKVCNDNLVTLRGDAACVILNDSSRQCLVMFYIRALYIYIYINKFDNRAWYPLCICSWYQPFPPMVVDFRQEVFISIIICYSSGVSPLFMLAIFSIIYSYRWLVVLFSLRGKRVKNRYKWLYSLTLLSLNWRVHLDCRSSSSTCMSC